MKLHKATLSGWKTTFSGLLADHQNQASIKLIE